MKDTSDKQYGRQRQEQIFFKNFLYVLVIHYIYMSMSVCITIYNLFIHVFMYLFMYVFITND